MDLLPAADTLWGFLALALGFGGIILIHELGHFLAAKWADIQVSQFAVGFGWPLVSWRSGLGLRLGSTEAETARILAQNPQAPLGETEYRWSALPLGGYVKMLGQDDLDPNALSHDPRSYNTKSVGARMVVISAGVVMNLLGAMVLFVIAFMAGVEFPQAVVGTTVPDLPAATTFAEGHDGDAAFLGLLPGDAITHVGGDRVGDFTDVRLASALAGDQPLELQVSRPGHPQPLRFHITPVRGSSGLPTLGIQSAYSLQIDPHARLDPGLLARGIEPGMRIVAVAGVAVESFAELRERLQGAGDDVQLTFAAADGRRNEVALKTTSADPLAVTALPLSPLMQRIQAENPLAAIRLGMHKTYQTMQSVYLTLLRLVQGFIPVKEMRGPVGIAETGTQIARDRGLMYLLYFLGVISVNLAVINFLPIPVVDGGHIVFLLAEKLKGTPVSPRMQALATYAGLALLAAVFLVTLFYDTVRLLRG